MRVPSFLHALLATALLLWAGSASASPIVYNLNRTVGGGSAVGTITTDGTLGILSSGNIVDWTITLASPTLLGGSPQVITKATSAQTLVGFTALTATSTQLIFDFSAPGGNGYFLLQGGNNNFWCLQVNGCWDFTGSAEAIGFGANTFLAERVARNGSQVIASTAAAVPEPASLFLLGSGFVGLAVKVRRRKQNR